MDGDLPFDEVLKSAQPNITTTPRQKAGAVLKARLVQVESGLGALAATYNLVRDIIDELHREALGKGPDSAASAAALLMAKQKLGRGKTQLERLSTAATIVKVNCAGLLRGPAAKGTKRKPPLQRAKSAANKARFSGSCSSDSLVAPSQPKARGSGDNMKAWRRIVTKTRGSLSAEELGNGRFNRGTPLCPLCLAALCLCTFSLVFLCATSGWQVHCEPQIL